MADRSNNEAAANHADHQHRPGSLPHWASNLEEHLDKLLLIILRDNHTFLGYLRSFDHFANLVVENCVRRHIVVEEKCYADVYLGTMTIRGENVCLFGEVDESRPLEMKEESLAYVLRREEEIEAERKAHGLPKMFDFSIDLVD
mmetsp:Transcript_60651/g.128430  ORF Transcript_60651/g.128430 Transcript_60651/m.128430 type:complete len:144 (-) Transcript_60651:253-684(-)